MNIFQAMHDTIREDFKSEHSIPPLLDKMVGVFSKAHIYYRMFKMGQIFHEADRNSSQGNPAVYGAALHLAADYTDFGSYAVNVALITKCAEDLLSEYRQLSETYQALCSACTWQYPVYQPVIWPRETSSYLSLLSPSRYLAWQVGRMKLIGQILKISQCAWTVFWQAFKLSMCLCDAYLMLQGDQQIRYEACTELVARLNHYQEQLKENQEQLLEEIKKGCDLADHLLTRLGVEEQSATIITQLAQKLGKVGQTNRKALDNLYEATEEALDSIYVKGKITPFFQINLTEEKTAPTLLPPQRFPPWAGQKVSIKTPPPTPATPSDEKENSFFKGVAFPFSDALKGLAVLTTFVYPGFSKPAQASDSSSQSA